MPASMTERAPHVADRDPFLELLRNISVLRVVLLHLVLRPPFVYFPWIQWIYPGMPEIFFVSGALAAASISRRGTASVLARRTKRVLLPYSVYAVVAVVAMVVTDRRTDRADSTFTASDVLSFVFPLVQPTGSATRAILWSHLWFVTVFLWLLLLTPLFMRVAERFGGWVVLPPLALVGFAVLGRQGLRWDIPSELGLIGQFGAYYCLGVASGRGLLGWFQRSGSASPHLADGVRRRWLFLAALAAVSGTVVGLVIEPISRKRPPELYSSRTAYLLIGFAWLALALALHGPLSRWTAAHRSRWLEACTQRTFTLYLWGLPADAVGVAVAKRFLPNRWIATPLYVLVSLAALAVAVLAVGWIEDYSAGRRLRLVPLDRAAETRRE
jgi:peptidoglycan/LPS O-acetylase OafA/YrhL